MLYAEWGSWVWEAPESISSVLFSWANNVIVELSHSRTISLYFFIERKNRGVSGLLCQEMVGRSQVEREVWRGIGNSKRQAILGGKEVNVSKMASFGAGARTLPGKMSVVFPAFYSL